MRLRVKIGHKKTQKSQRLARKLESSLAAFLCSLCPFVADFFSPNGSAFPEFFLQYLPCPVDAGLDCFRAALCGFTDFEVAHSFVDEEGHGLA